MILCIPTSSYRKKSSNFLDVASKSVVLNTLEVGGLWPGETSFKISLKDSESATLKEIPVS
jgi:hypothetical protein